MKDKTLVAKYLSSYLKAAAYFGYTKGVNIEQIVQIFRRVHKDASQVPTDELLNLLLFISVSETFYKDFDDKQVVYINQALDIIESQFTGTETITAQKSPNRDDTVTLSFFKQISIPIKTYNKQAIR